MSALKNSLIVNVGSINADFVYEVPHFAKPGETLASSSFSRFPGGKGLNQSIALAKAGATVYHVGKVAGEGIWLKDFMLEQGVKVDFVEESGSATGHAIIQVDSSGQNTIILFPGANSELQPQNFKVTLESIKPGWLLLQNETNAIDEAMLQANSLGIKIAMNPAPISENLKRLPLHLVDLLFVNEVEGESLTNESAPERIVSTLQDRFPDSSIILTLGANGVIYSDSKQTFSVPSYRVKVIDSTAAGDTFIGYFLAAKVEGKSPKECVTLASKAAALSVMSKGAAASIPHRTQVENFNASYLNS